MKILIADDDSVSRKMLQNSASRWGYETVAVGTGEEALAVLHSPHPPAIAILDWLMPDMSGPEVCREVRSHPQNSSTYIVLLTSRGATGDVVHGLESGADDYIVKPFNQDELRARVQVGARVVRLQRALAERVYQLEAALERERQLMGLLPICAYCKQIRDDQQEWQPIETYLAFRSDFRFSHSICPTCARKVEAEINQQA